MTDGPLVTVCVPAYRSERFIAHTLAALQAQTFRDFGVRIGLEPVEEGPTVEACRPFLADPRFELVINEQQLGWDANTAALLETVRTPLFCILPHDDVPRSDHLQELVGTLLSRPDASVAYSDMLSFGASSGRRSNLLPDLPQRSQRELGFFLAGAEGTPFKGVARSTVLSRRFPSNDHRGFAVETEWALHLVQQGVALRGRRPTYLKRQFDRTGDSVSIGWRFAMARDELVAALEHNRARLLAAIGPDEPDGASRELVLLAAEAAMLRRWSLIPGEPLPFGKLQLARASAVLAVTGSLATEPASRIRAMVHVALARHHAATGDRVASIEAARLAVSVLPDDKEACLLLGQLALANGELDQAIDLLVDAAHGSPLDDGVLRLIEATSRELTRRYAALAPADAREPNGTPR